jgi:hypothetical protein
MGVGISNLGKGLLVALLVLLILTAVLTTSFLEDQSQITQLQQQIHDLRGELGLANWAINYDSLVNASSYQVIAYDMEFQLPPATIVITGNSSNGTVGLGTGGVPYTGPQIYPTKGLAKTFVPQEAGVVLIVGQRNTNGTIEILHGNWTVYSNGSTSDCTPLNGCGGIYNYFLGSGPIDYSYQCKAQEPLSVVFQNYDYISTLDVHLTIVFLPRSST